MKQYRLLKDFPHLKAGTIFPHLAGNVYGIDGGDAFHEDFMKEYPEWFEEVKPFEWTDEKVLELLKWAVSYQRHHNRIKEMIEEFKQQKAQYNTDLG